MAQGAARWLGRGHGVHAQAGTGEHCAAGCESLCSSGKRATGRRPANRLPPDPSLYDGRFANVGWLQELPKQITNLSWDNAALMSLATAEGLGVEQNDAIEISANGRKVIAPVLVVPGHADGAVTVHLGFGRGPRPGAWGRGLASTHTFYAPRTTSTPSGKAHPHRRHLRYLRHQG